MAYKFTDYTKSDEVKKADAKAAEYDTYTRSDETQGLFDKKTDYETNNNPGEWDANANGWQDVQNAYNDWSNRKAFSYDLNGDTLYQQYKDKYINQGRLAMADTIGQASAMTGGYGSSYAVTAGNQAYQSSLQNLNDIVPQLYQMAYDRYNQEGQDMLNKYSMLNNMYSTKYGEHRDNVSDYNTNLDRLITEAYNAQNFEYGSWNNDRTHYTNVANNLYTNEFNAHNVNETNKFNAYTQGVNEDYQNKQLELSERQVALQEAAAQSKEIVGLTDDQIEIFEGYVKDKAWSKIDRYILSLPISDEDKKRLAQYWLPDIWLNPTKYGAPPRNTNYTIG